MSPPADKPLLLSAVRNNAAWCDAVCRSHGGPGTFEPHAWVSRAATPPFYPNLVTLSGAEGAEAQFATVTSLAASGLARPWAVKDSFATLDLIPLGFRPLFDATWIGRLAALPFPPVVAPDVEWVVVREAVMLAAWEAAWGAEAEPPEERVFRPALLADPAVAILAGVRDGRVIAGVVANRSDGVTGLSNLFVPHDVPALRAAALTVVAAVFPGTALVGYEHGAVLAAMLALGFTALGPLRVWELDGTAL
jgi:hypothetical protein